MPYVLGLDPSLARAGITVLRRADDGVARPKVLRDTGYSLPDTAGWDEHSDRIVVNAREVYGIIDRLPERPVLALIEAMIPPKNALPSYMERVALWYGIWSGLKARNIPRTVIQPGTLKAWATGAGRADKDMVLAEVRTWWPAINIANHDIADSAVCAAMCAKRLGWTLPFPTRRRHLDSLTSVRWPELPDAPDMSKLGSPRWTGV